MMEWIAQAIGFIAFALGVTAFLQKTDQRLRLGMLAQGVTLSLHFILMGAYTGAVMAFLSGTRAGLSLYPWAKRTAPLFYAATLIFAYVTYQQPVDILPMLSGLVATTGFFFLSGVPMRLCFVFGTSCWLAHNIIIGSWGPSMMEGFMLCVLLYRLWGMIRSPVQVD